MVILVHPEKFSIEENSQSSFLSEEFLDVSTFGSTEIFIVTKPNICFKIITNTTKGINTNILQTCAFEMIEEAQDWSYLGIAFIEKYLEKYNVSFSDIKIAKSFLDTLSLLIGNFDSLIGIRELETNYVDINKVIDLNNPLLNPSQKYVYEMNKFKSERNVVSQKVFVKEEKVNKGFFAWLRNGLLTGKIKEITLESKNGKKFEKQNFGGVISKSENFINENEISHVCLIIGNIFSSDIFRDDSVEDSYDIDFSNRFYRFNYEKLINIPEKKFNWKLYFLPKQTLEPIKITDKELQELPKRLSVEIDTGLVTDYLMIYEFE